MISSMNRKVGGNVIAGVVLVSVGLDLILSLTPDAYPRWAVIHANAEPQDPGSVVARDVVAAAGRHGNVFIRFFGFDPPQPTDAQLAGRVFFRSNYALHPRRAYVANDDVPINTGIDMLRSNFNPTTAWCQAHQVETVILYRRTGALSGDISFYPVPPATPPNTQP
jgi:hypothetical protein